MSAHDRAVVRATASYRLKTQIVDTSDHPRAWPARRRRDSRRCKGGPQMHYLPRNASRMRLREAQRARDNRAEIRKALSTGQVTRRELYKWGIFTATGMLALKNGLSPFAPSALADGTVPTGTPPSPL